MKYYELEYKHFFDKNDEKKRRQIGEANGEKVPNGKPYFDRMGNGEIIKDAPICECFFLMSMEENFLFKILLICVMTVYSGVEMAEGEGMLEPFQAEMDVHSDLKLIYGYGVIVGHGFRNRCECG